MVGSRVMVSRSIAELLEDDISLLDFIEDSIKLLLRSKRPFLICTKYNLPPLVVQIDKDGISIAFLIEL